MPRGVIETPALTLNGEAYRLIREEQRELIPGLPRRWRVERQRVATKYTPRADVRPGDIKDEWVITWDRFNQGLTGDHENLPGAVHYSENIEILEGALRASGIHVTLTDASNLWNNVPEHHGIVIEFNRSLFLLIGRYAFTVSNGALTTDKDFGASYRVFDAVVHNNELVACFGGSTNKIETRNTSGSWTAATDATYADYFAKVEDRLWRATNTNEVSNIGPTDNARTLANWSSAITVGDDDRRITDLNAQGEQVIVSKEEGLFFGDRAAIFPNRLEGIVPNWENGLKTFVFGDAIFYPTRERLLLYQRGNVQEVGLDQVFQSAASENVPGLRMRAMAAIGSTIFMATEPSYQPRADPTGFQVTTDIGVSYTNATTNVSDNDEDTVATLDALDTVANGDWFIIGYSAAFYGFLLDMRAVNINNVAMDVTFWNGSAWTAFPADRAANDMTIERIGTTEATLGRAGGVFWSIAPAAWAASTINGINAFWVRCQMSAALSATVRVSECRILTEAPKSFIFKGRRRRQDDSRMEPIIWEPAHMINDAAPFVTGMNVIEVGGNKRALNLVLLSQNMAKLIWLSYSPLDAALEEQTGSVFFARHDGGFPEENKQYTQFRLKGRTIDSDRDVTLQYRLDEATAWTSVATITSSPSTQTLSAITGRAIQPRIDFNAFGNDVLTEVNELECVFRLLPTYKNIYTAYLELGYNQGIGRGGTLPSADVQLTNLEALHGGSAVTLIEPGPLRRSRTVHVLELRQVELAQSEHNLPSVIIELQMAEV